MHMCQERADIMYSVKEIARKITCPTESDEVKVKVFQAQRDQQFSFVRERVHRQRLGRTTPKRARAQVVESSSGEARLFLLGPQHSSQ